RHAAAAAEPGDGGGEEARALKRRRLARAASKTWGPRGESAGALVLCQGPAHPILQRPAPAPGAGLTSHWPASGYRSRGSGTQAPLKHLWLCSSSFTRSRPGYEEDLP